MEKQQNGIAFTLNGKEVQVSVDPDTPLLWVLRDTLGLTGTKFGCGIGSCGACTIHMDDIAMRSCSLPLNTVAGKSITTIEGLSENGDHPVQRAWLETDVAQCGYCQAGQIMAATAFLLKNNSPDDGQIARIMNGNICRCGTYLRIKEAVVLASRYMQSEKQNEE